MDSIPANPPSFAASRIAQRIHVTKSDRAAIREASASLIPELRYTRQVRDVRHAFYRQVLTVHHEQQDFFHNIFKGASHGNEQQS